MSSYLLAKTFGFHSQINKIILIIIAIDL